MQHSHSCGWEMLLRIRHWSLLGSPGTGAIILINQLFCAITCVEWLRKWNRCTKDGFLSFYCYLGNIRGCAFTNLDAKNTENECTVCSAVQAVQNAENLDNSIALRHLFTINSLSIGPPQNTKTPKRWDNVFCSTTTKLRALHLKVHFIPRKRESRRIKEVFLCSYSVYSATHKPHIEKCDIAHLKDSELIIVLTSAWKPSTKMATSKLKST